MAVDYTIQYTPLNWQDNGPPDLIAANLNHMESAIKDSADTLDSMNNPPDFGASFTAAATS